MKMVLYSKSVEIRGVEHTAKGYYLIHVEAEDGTPFTFFARRVEGFEHLLTRGREVVLTFNVDSRYMNLEVIGVTDVRDLAME